MAQFSTSDAAKYYQIQTFGEWRCYYNVAMLTSSFRFRINYNRFLPSYDLLPILHPHSFIVLKAWILRMQQSRWSTIVCHSLDPNGLYLHPCHKFVLTKTQRVPRRLGLVKVFSSLDPMSSGNGLTKKGRARKRQSTGKIFSYHVHVSISLFIFHLWFLWMCA